jgi:hypothetical protein
MKKLGLLSLLVISILTSCAKENASDVNQDKIYTDYEVFYNQNTDKTWVVAKFRFGGPTGTILELDSTSYVTFNSDTLAYNPLYTGHFKEYAGRITAGSFKYENVDGQIFVNSIPAVDVLAFAADFDTLKKTQAQTITWVGTALGSNETVGLLIGNGAWGQAALALQDLDGATNLILGIPQMTSLAIGNSTVYMDRQHELDVIEGTSKGGKIRAKYRALNKVVQVVN